MYNMKMIRNSNEAAEATAPNQANLAKPFCVHVSKDFVLAPELRQQLVQDVTNAIFNWARSRAEEVLTKPGSYGPDLTEVRWQICGCVADDLHHDLGEWVEEILENAWPKT